MKENALPIDLPGPLPVLLALVTALTPVAGATQTESIEMAPAAHVATFWREGDPGDRLKLTGQVFSVDGKPIAGAVIDLRQADGAGNYQPDAYHGRIRTDARGRYEVRTVVPESYYGARHIHLTVTHEDAMASTQVLFKGDPNLPEGDYARAVVLEESRVQGGVVYIGTFDIVLPGS